jgi:hypothetical protein
MQGAAKVRSAAFYRYIMTLLGIALPVIENGSIEKKQVALHIR